MSLSEIIKEGLNYLNKGDYNSAGIIFYDLHEENPTNTTAAYNLARVYFHKSIEEKNKASKKEKQFSNIALNLLEKKVISNGEQVDEANFLIAEIYDLDSDLNPNLAIQYLNKINKPSRIYNSAQEFISELEVQISVKNLIERLENKKNTITEKDYEQTIEIMSQVDNFEHSRRQKNIYLDLIAIQKMFFYELDINKDEMNNFNKHKKIIIQTIINERIDRITTGMYNNKENN